MLLSPLVVIFVGLASVLIVLGVLFGSPLYVPGAYVAELTETPNCVFPCWNGIVPGQTRRSPVHAYLNTAGYDVESPMVSIISASGLVYRHPMPNHCAIRLNFNNGFVDSVRLTGCPQMTLGEAMLMFGQPQRASFYGGRISFQENSIQVETDTDCYDRLTPDTPVKAVIFTLADEFTADGSATSTEMVWSGFKHRHYYTPTQTTYSRSVRCALY
jgi:hypothetical protein